MIAFLVCLFFFLMQEVPGHLEGATGILRVISGTFYPAIGQSGACLPGVRIQILPGTGGLGEVGERGSDRLLLSTVGMRARHRAWARRSLAQE